MVHVAVVVRAEQYFGSIPSADVCWVWITHPNTVIPRIEIVWWQWIM